MNTQLISYAPPAHEPMVWATCHTRKLPWSGYDQPPSLGEVHPLVPADIQINSRVPSMMDLAWLRDRLADALQVIGHRTDRAIEQLEVLIVDDEQMSRLHRQFKQIDSTTDVLTFDMTSDDSNGVEAQIVVCVDEARRRAAERQHSIERELLLYCVHGVLHCMGFDDHDPAGFQKMHEEEDRVLQEIGVEPTFGNDDFAEHDGGGPR